jgi:hypothetical protein
MPWPLWGLSKINPCSESGVIIEGIFQGISSFLLLDFYPTLGPNVSKCWRHMPLVSYRSVPWYQQIIKCNTYTMHTKTVKWGCIIYQ